jgi:alkylation response protein AidB-like acyl-CoA dehydrogenase
MALKEPRPGMPQSEKDKLGKAIADTQNAELAAAAEAARQATWSADAALDSYDREALEAEAELRGVKVKATQTDASLVEALKAARTSTPGKE